MSVGQGLKTLMCKSALTVTDIKCVSDVTVFRSSQVTSKAVDTGELLTKKLIISFILHSPAAMTVAKSILKQVLS